MGLDLDIFYFRKMIRKYNFITAARNHRRQNIAKYCKHFPDFLIRGQYRFIHSPNINKHRIHVSSYDRLETRTMKKKH